VCSSTSIRRSPRVEQSSPPSTGYTSGSDLSGVGYSSGAVAQGALCIELKTCVGGMPGSPRSPPLHRLSHPDLACSVSKWPANPAHLLAGFENLAAVSRLASESLVGQIGDKRVASLCIVTLDSDLVVQRCHVPA